MRCQKKLLIQKIPKLILLVILVPVISGMGKPLSNVNIKQQLTALETATGGKIGLYAINIGNNQRFEYRAKKRFPMCSTAKVMAVAAILKQSMINRNLLQQKITYTKKDVVSAGYGPVTQKNLATGMTITELGAAAITQSDNAAMNLLMRKLGGPGMVTAFARFIGDDTFRLERWEPELNSAIPGDLRDTTTPQAMGKSLQCLLFTKVLAKPQRELLRKWLKNNKTGNDRIRVGVPAGWIIGDKTGTGEYGTTNDVGVIWPPKCSPIIVVIYFTQNQKNAAPRDDIIAAVTRILIKVPNLTLS